MPTATQTMTIHDYATGKAIGEIYMPARQAAAYIRESGDTGVITVADLVSYGCEIVWSDVPEHSCRVYLME